jgi:hypothetical protein
MQHSIGLLSDTPPPAGEARLEGSAPPLPRNAMALLVLFTLVAAGIRVAAANGDLWFDEIWSLALISNAHSAADVLLRLHHDNNHHLNSLYLYLLGDGHTALAYRGASLLAGVFTVALAAVAAIRRTGVCVLTTSALLCASSLLVQFSSEARGYAPAALFAVACYVLFSHYVTSRSRLSAFAFAVTSVLGVLSHLTFLYVGAAFFVWWIADTVNTWRTRRFDWWTVAAFALPIAACAVLWWVDLRAMRAGGCSPWVLGPELRSWARSVFGVPRSGPLELMVAGPLAAAALEILALWKENRGRSLFFATATLAAPAAVLASNPECFAGRYLFLSAPFLLMLVASQFARWLESGRAPRILAIAFVAAFVAGNAILCVDLVTRGRGQYAKAIAAIALADPAPVVTVAGDHDLRDGLVFMYHAHQLGLSHRLRYVTREQWQQAPPRWFIVHTGGTEPAIIGPLDAVYRFDGVFAAAEFTRSMTWSVYRATWADRSR